MRKQMLKDTVGWGVVLWLIGYVLGIALFAVVPPGTIGWFIMPIGLAITLWVAFRKVQGDRFSYYGVVAIGWTVIAIVADYLLLVKLFKPADGYYKLDVYLYYVLTLAIPLLAGWRKTMRRA
jgi:hypothetical protein